MNASPWITKKYTYPQSKSLHSDIVIIGGGISGLATAYFLLKETLASVSIIEMNTIGSGATGHNAGNVTADLEIPIIDAVKKYGEDLSVQSYFEISDAWKLFDQIIAEIHQPVEKIQMYEFYKSKEAILKNVLQTLLWRKHDILSIDTLMLSENYPYLSELANYSDIVHLVAQAEINEIAGNSGYYLAVKNPAAHVNSYEMTNEICSFLTSQYSMSERFKVFQDTTVNLIRKDNSYMFLDASNGTFTSQKVILCTNGYKNLKFGVGMEQIDLEEIIPTISFMVGELTDESVVSYQKEHEYGYTHTGKDQFVYAGSRKYKDQALKTFGGLDEILADLNENMPSQKKEKLQELYRHLYDDQINSNFSWSGIMGYTKNGFRKVGTHSDNQNLLYNLGCNGSGILSGIWGGKRLADTINKKKLLPTIFD